MNGQTQDWFCFNIFSQALNFVSYTYKLHSLITTNGVIILFYFQCWKTIKVIVLNQVLKYIATGNIVVDIMGGI